MTRPSVAAKARELASAEGAAKALSFLRAQLGSERLPPGEVIALGKLVSRLQSTDPGEGRLTSVLILGQCTTSWLVQALSARALAVDLHCQVHEGAFDNVLQSLAALAGDDVPDVLVLLPWHQRLLARNDVSSAERLELELDFWREVWTLAAQKGVKRIIQVGYDWMNAGPLGFHLAGGDGGDIDLVTRANQRLRQSLPAGGYFIALDAVSGVQGRQHFYDARALHWTRQPFSEAGLVELATHIAAGLRASLWGPCKVLVLDLDNTLWGGVVGETGPLGIGLGDSAAGESFLSFQRYLKGLSERGILLAVCSKNNPADAKEPFLQHPDMVLKLSDFAYFEASWEPKSTGIIKIAEELNLGLDSFVFFDDSDFERELVRQALPSVKVVNVPSEPAEYINALQRGLWFESGAVTEEDKRRSALYQAQVYSREAREQSGSVEEYLQSLQMTASVCPISEADLPRIVQMLGKTNQFNLTTRRHGLAEVREILQSPGGIGFSLRLRDRFADHGLVALLLAKASDECTSEKTLVIDSFLMSCRVIGRTVEGYFIRTLAQHAVKAGFVRLEGEYIPSPKNHLVALLFEQMGFERIRETEGGGSVCCLQLPAAIWPRTFVSNGS